MLDFVQMTAAYSNAVLTAILPHVSDFAQKLELSVPLPITTNEIREFRCDPRAGQIGGAVILTNGFAFVFEHGHVAHFETPKSYYSLQDPSRIPEFYGPVNLDKAGAVAFVRGILSKLDGVGIDVLIQPTPKIIEPDNTGPTTVPRYEIDWPPDSQWSKIRVEVDASNRSIQMMSLFATNFWRENPKVDVVPLPVAPQNPKPALNPNLKPVSQAYSNALLVAVLPLVTEYSQKLDLPIDRPVTTNAVADFDVHLFEGTPTALIVLTNGFKFAFTHGYVSAFQGLNGFFVSYADLGKKTYADFIAPVVMTREEMIQLGRSAVAKLGYSEKELPVLAKDPVLRGGPNMGTTPDMARFYFQWDYSSEADPYPPAIVGFEVDASTKTLKSLKINHPNLWRAPPKIDVPINP